jgi:hypothetical protein
MNFPERLIETSSTFRARATALAASAIKDARERAGMAARRVGLEESLAVLTFAGRELNKVAKRHASRFVKENSAIARAAGKDFGSLARSTYVSLAARQPVVNAGKPRTATARKRAKKKAS